MNCKNCGNSLNNEDGFCSQCGARIIEDRISIRFLLKEILDKVLSVDNKLLKTFLHMFFKPEAVINGYISGVRKRYIDPFSYLLISITLAGISFYFLREVAIENINTTSEASSQPGNPFENKEFLTSFINFIFDYQAVLTAIIIPVYAFISWIVFLNRKTYNYLEHIVIYLYGNAQFSVVNFIVTTPLFFINKEAGNLASLVISGLTIVYFSYILIRLFKLTFLQFVIKTLYFFLVGIVMYVIAIIASGFVMYFYMGPEYFKQFKKQQQQQDSIQKIQKKDTIQKAIHYYEASSKLNCLSYKFL